jgi:hypothetical protein
MYMYKAFTYWFSDINHYPSTPALRSLFMEDMVMILANSVRNFIQSF